MPPATASITSRNGWTAGTEGRASSSSARLERADALTSPASVFADVASRRLRRGCANATLDDAGEAVERLQRQPGNDFAPELAPNSRPLGSFDDRPDRDGSRRATTMTQTIVRSTDRARTRRGRRHGERPLRRRERRTTARHSATRRHRGRRRTAAATLPRATAADLDRLGRGTAPTTMTPACRRDRTTVVIVHGRGERASATTSNDFDVVETICTSSTTATCALRRRQDRRSAGRRRAADIPEREPRNRLQTRTLDLLMCTAVGHSAVGGALVNINPRDYPTNAPITSRSRTRSPIRERGPRQLRRLPQQGQRADVELGSPLRSTCARLLADAAAVSSRSASERRRPRRSLSLRSGRRSLDGLGLAA